MQERKILKVGMKKVHSRQKAERIQIRKIKGKQI
jgi:hypothetical protein